MAAEADAVLVEPAPTGQRRWRHRRSRRLVGRGGPLLVGEEEDDVGAVGHERAPRRCAARPASIPSDALASRRASKGGDEAAGAASTPGSTVEGEAAPVVPFPSGSATPSGWWAPPTTGGEALEGRRRGSEGGSHSVTRSTRTGPPRPGPGGRCRPPRPGRSGRRNGRRPAAQRADAGRRRSRMA